MAGSYSLSILWLWDLILMFWVSVCSYFQLLEPMKFKSMDPWMHSFLLVSHNSTNPVAFMILAFVEQNMFSGQGLAYSWNKSVKSKLSSFSVNLWLK